MIAAELLRRLREPLAQRVVNVDTHELADEYSFRISAAERKFLIELLSDEPDEWKG